jgi:hypothetical protein
MAVKTLPPTELLRQLFQYDSESGNLFYKAGPRLGKPAFTAIHKWGYYIGHVSGQRFRAHRIIWKMQTGRDPLGQIDHIDGDKKNNKWSNLRDVSSRENSRNMPKLQRNQSGVTGVSKLAKSKKWRARIWGDKEIYIGLFASKEDAIAARKQYEKLLGYHTNHGRETCGKRRQGMEN